MRAIAPMSIVLLTLASCSSTQIGAFSFASTRELRRSYPTVQQHVVGEDCSNLIFLLPLASFSPSPQTAVDRALAQAPGADMLTNVTIRSEVFVTLLFNRGCISVEGDAVSTQAATQATAGEFTTSGGAGSRIALDRRR